MITKTYHIITIGFTQIINSTLNSNLYFAILKKVHWIGPKWLKMDQIDQSEPNRPKWTK